MSCSLREHLKNEHENMRDPKYENIICTCPVLDRQICLWCCLHIRDVANPQSRNYSTDFHPDYATKIPELVGRDLDSIWESCTRCQNQA